MPMYSYVCKHCEAEFEAFATIKMKEDGWRPKCPQCGSSDTRQLFKTRVMFVSSNQRLPSDGGCCSQR
jgi:putative FmdB family regulatory protein